MKKIVIYSGGAKGVDITAQSVALNKGGAVVAYIADSLAGKIKEKDISQYVAEVRLLLISNLKPDAGFSAGRAMNRNIYMHLPRGHLLWKLITTKEESGMVQQKLLKINGGDVLILDNSLTGNKKLIEAGGNAYNITDKKLIDLIMNKKDKSQQEEYTQINLLDLLS